MTDEELMDLAAYRLAGTCRPEFSDLTGCSLESKEERVKLVERCGGKFMADLRYQAATYGKATLWLHRSARGYVSGLEVIPLEWQGNLDRSSGKLAVAVPFCQYTALVDYADLVYMEIPQ